MGAFGKKTCQYDKTGLVLIICNEQSLKYCNVVNPAGKTANSCMQSYGWPQVFSLQWQSILIIKDDNESLMDLNSKADKDGILKLDYRQIWNSAIRLYNVPVGNMVCECTSKSSDVLLC